MHFFRDWRRKKILESHPIPDAVWEKGLELVPLLDDLSDEEVEKLRALATIFLHEKRFEGASGFIIDDTVKIVIACLGCLVVLELDIDAYRGWSSIVVYRSEFKTRHEYVDEHGIAHEENGPQAGESWPGGPIVLSWEDVVESVEEPYDGFNVVIHEFAHKLDMLQGGDADGMPPLHEGMSVAEWKLVVTSAYEDFCHRVDLGEDTGLDEYGAESEAEFFAVMCEVFFEAPDVLSDEYPKLYDQLRLFFRQDPLRRMPPPEQASEHVPEHH